MVSAPTALNVATPGKKSLRSALRIKRLMRCGPRHGALLTHKENTELRKPRADASPREAKHNQRLCFLFAGGGSHQLSPISVGDERQPRGPGHIASGSFRI